MIAKTTIGRSFKGCLAYTLGKVEQGQGEMLMSQGVRDYDRTLMVADFTRQAKLHPDLTRSVWHTAVSFSPQDEARLQQEPELMAKVARAYLEGMGLAQSQYVVVRHRDTDHTHFHLVANRVREDGQVVSDSHNFSRSERLLRQIEQTHGLAPMKEQERRKNVERVPERDRQRLEIRDQVRTALQVATNGKELQAELNQVGIKMRVNRGQDGQARGVSFEREESDKQGQRVRVAFKGSKLHQRLSIGGITEQLQQNALHVQKAAQEQRNNQNHINTPPEGQTPLREEKHERSRGMGRGM